MLGVAKVADDAAIKRAYRQLAKKYHPDVNPGNKEAEEKFKEINEAYQVLSDPQKRQQYDRFGPDGPAAAGAGGYGDFSGFGGFGGFGGFDVEDIFSSFFGGGSRSRRDHGPVPGADVRYDLSLKFEEAAKAAKSKSPWRMMKPAKPATVPAPSPARSRRPVRPAGEPVRFVRAAAARL